MREAASSLRTGKLITNGQSGNKLLPKLAFWISGLSFHVRSYSRNTITIPGRTESHGYMFTSEVLKTSVYRVKRPDNAECFHRKFFSVPLKNYQEEHNI